MSQGGGRCQRDDFRQKALKNQISALLSSIQNKAVTDTALTEQEKGFISSTTIPVFKYG